MASFNKWIGLGNLTRDPEHRDTSRGGGVTKFTLAVDHRRGGEGDKETLFMDVEAWGRTGEVIHQYVRKGDPLLVEGRLRLDRWEKDGTKHSKIVCVAETFEFLRGKKSEG